jgi:hypothetical protein
MEHTSLSWPYLCKRRNNKTVNGSAGIVGKPAGTSDQINKNTNFIITLSHTPT